MTFRGLLATRRLWMLRAVLLTSAGVIAAVALTHHASAAGGKPESPAPGADGVVALSGRTIVATRSLPGGEKAELTSYRSNAGLCLEVMYPGTRDTTGGCGFATDARNTSHKVGWVVVPAHDGNQFAFGPTSADVRHVVVSPAFGGSKTVTTAEFPRATAASATAANDRYFFTEIPGLADVTAISGLDAAGTRVYTARGLRRLSP
jgi:hypothetical protein